MSVFFNKIKKLSKIKTRFFVPGHKGNKKALKPFGSVLKYDLTEIEGADDLQCPKQELLKSQKQMAKAFGAGTSTYSAAGCSSCIMAMLTMFLSQGDTVIMARNSHISAIKAVGFVGLSVAWIVPSCENIFDINILEEQIAKSNAKAVYVTSPSYYGFISNISEISMLCKKHNISLLVDNAHGSHLKFLTRDLHPLTLGATAVADSVHKTLPCLTGAAVLNIADKDLVQKARWAVNLYSSTSPSYLILSSLGMLAEKLDNKKIDFKTAEMLCTSAKAKLGGLVLDQKNLDPLKITLVPSLVGHTVQQVQEALKTQGVVPEMVDDLHIVLMASPYNKKSDYEKIVKACSSFSKTQICEYALYKKIALPKKVLDIRTASFGEKITIPVEKSENKIAAAIITPCPPGVPIIMPGEKITLDIIDKLIKSGICSVDVVK